MSSASWVCCGLREGLTGGWRVATVRASSKASNRFGDDRKALAGARQNHLVCAAVEELDAQSFLERAHAAAERRLGNAARRGRARETAGMYQGGEILEPCGFLCACPPLAASRIFNARRALAYPC